MNKLLKSTFVGLTAVGVLGAGSLLGASDAMAQGSATIGNLRGQIRDKAAGGGAPGATVVATSPALVGEQVVLTDDNGLYYITSLPPGVYTLTVYYENKTFSRSNVLIQIGKEAVVNVTVDPTAGAATGSPGSGEIIVIQGTVPIVDQGSTKIGVTLNDDYVRNIPVGRTFGAVLESAAGTQGDQYGTSISGATSAENTYIVEGINTTDTAVGGISSNLPTEFIQETEVITGGYNAEFGRATGGIINVVTKSGSNEFRGSIFGYYRPGALVADAEVIAAEGSSIDTVNNLDYNWDVGAELGGPIIKDKLWFHVGFNPSRTKSTTTRSITSLQDGDGTAATADGIVDTDANGFSIRNPVEGASRDLDNTSQTYFYTAKINGAIGPQHQFQISAFGNPSSGEVALGNQIRNPNFSRIGTDVGAYDFASKWTSRFNEGKTQIDAVVGFHRGYDATAPLSADQNIGLVRDNFTRSLYDFRELEGSDALGICDDNAPGDLFPEIRNCPVLAYASQGLGFVEDRTNDRTSAILSVTQRVKLAGYHTFKVGIDVDFASYDSTRGNTGGAAAIRINTRGNYQVSQFLQVVRPLADGEDPMLMGNELLCVGDNAVCAPQDSITVSANNRSYAAYLQDSWQIRPSFTLNAGIRWEQQNGFVAEELQGKLSPDGEIIPERAYQLNNQWAPRLGAIWDPTQEGKSKIFASWGRFYENVPMQINVRAFGGEIQDLSRTAIDPLVVPGDPRFDPACVQDFTPGVDLIPVLLGCANRRSVRQLGGATEFVAPGLQGQYTQEFILGAEYELFADLKVGISYIHRSIPRIIEDVSTDGGNNYLIANPGEDFSDQANDLRTQAAQLEMNGDTELAALFNSRADQLDSVKTFDAPVRNYDAVQLMATQRFTKNSLLLASYTYSVSKGNYPGLFSTETGQLDPNLTSLYDLPELMANRYGNMGLDRPHLLKIDGFYAFDLKKAGIITVGTSLRAQSGIPRNTLAANVFYGEDESYLLPRGDIGRSPVTEQIDMHLAYGYQINKTTRLEGFVRFFNLLNAQDQLNAEDTYTVDNANPVVGGDLEDLDHVRQLSTDTNNDTNIGLARNKNFGNITARQSPRNIQLGFRLTF